MPSASCFKLPDWRRSESRGRFYPTPFLHVAGKLAEGDDGGIEFLEASANADYLLLAVALGVAAHELNVVD